MIIKNSIDLLLNFEALIGEDATGDEIGDFYFKIMMRPIRKIHPMFQQEIYALHGCT